MLVGKLLPNKVYTVVKGLVQTPDGQQYRGMGKSTLSLVFCGARRRRLFSLGSSTL